MANTRRLVYLCGDVIVAITVRLLKNGTEMKIIQKLWTFMNRLSISDLNLIRRLLQFRLLSERVHLNSSVSYDCDELIMSAILSKNPEMCVEINGNRLWKVNLNKFSNLLQETSTLQYFNHYLTELNLSGVQIPSYFVTMILKECYILKILYLGTNASLESLIAASHCPLSFLEIDLHKEYNPEPRQNICEDTLKKALFRSSGDLIRNVLSVMECVLSRRIITDSQLACINQAVHKLSESFCWKTLKMFEFKSFDLSDDFLIVLLCCSRLEKVSGYKIDYNRLFNKMYILHQLCKFSFRSLKYFKFYKFFNVFQDSNQLPEFSELLPSISSVTVIVQNGLNLTTFCESVFSITSIRSLYLHLFLNDTLTHIVNYQLCHSLQLLSITGIRISDAEILNLLYACTSLLHLQINYNSIYKNKEKLVKQLKKCNLPKLSICCCNFEKNFFSILRWMTHLQELVIRSVSPSSNFSLADLHQSLFYNSSIKVLRLACAVKSDFETLIKISSSHHSISHFEIQFAVQVFEGKVLKTLETNGWCITTPSLL